MRWTVGQRIAVGYAVILLLLLIVAGMGMLTLSGTSDAFKTAIVGLEKDLVNALEAGTAFSAPNVDFLRFLATADDDFLNRYEKGMAHARQTMAELARKGSNKEMKDAWEKASSLLDAWDDKTKRAMSARKASRMDEALRFRGEAQPFREQLVALLDRLVDSARREANEITKVALAEGARGSWVIFGVAGLALVAGTAIAWTLTRSITGQLRETIGTLASASSEILAATTQQASGTAEEATAVQETSTTVDEVKQTAQVAAQKARAVAEAAQKAAQVSQDGRRAVEDSVKGTQEAKARMEALAERILVLSEQGQAIGEIMATVKDLAEQSNLLAVNAAIEAAKAGEAGKGFAVVAAEVKGLAEQSKQAATQVRGILSEIQKATQAAVMAAEQGVKASEAGVAVAAKAGDAIRVLTEGLTESAQAAQQILASAQQQAGGMDQVALAMENIRQASTQNMASTRQVERAAQDLNTLAGQLKALVAASGNRRSPG
jgi:methyl-accepting chemotaxis protein